MNSSKLKFGVLTLLSVVSMAVSSVSSAADEYLVKKSLGELMAAQSQIQQLILRNPRLAVSLRLVNQQLTSAENDLFASLGQMLPPPPVVSNPMIGYYCSAACTSGDGRADLRTIDGASGEFETQARENATNKVQSEMNCTWGVKVTECSPAYRESTFNSGAACTAGDGTPDLRTARGGQGASKVEAEVMAARSTQNTNQCTWGLAQLETSSDLVSTYCVAACTTGGGDPDNRASRGAQGRNKSDAMLKALMQTQSAFSCTWGIKVTTCESR